MITSLNRPGYGTDIGVLGMLMLDKAKGRYHSRIQLAFKAEKMRQGAWKACLQMNEYQLIETWY